ncbi:hypothetical protein [Actinomadura gamaensis]|uniref:Uncharacterized protein n=1 Tax=Actinomadura gamaensis TaxID=1763541 RepID=A0ABV9U0M2_9ACTN
MSDVMLPWPEPRRPDRDQRDAKGPAPRREQAEGKRSASGREQPEGKRSASGREQAAGRRSASGREQAEAKPSAPRYELRSVMDDGSAGPVEVLPIVRPPWDAKAGRRGFLGAGIASSVAAAMLLSACGTKENPSPTYGPGGAGGPSDSPTGADTPSDTYSPTYTPPDSPSESPSDEPSDTYSPPEYTPPDTGGGGGGRICTCNKVCTCIPICQAHRLLDADAVVRRMAETVVVAMGLDELPYLRWAASEAASPLRRRIERLVAELRDGRRLRHADLHGFDCDPYLDSADPVVATMAAQVLTLRALALGTRLTGPLGERVAHALRAGHALHAERALAWTA